MEEVVDDGSRDLVALLEAAEAGAMATRIVRQTVNFYDGAAFTGLEAGKVADYGVLVRSAALAVTVDGLHELYRSGAAPMSPPEEPPYLARGSAPWPDEYPAQLKGGARLHVPPKRRRRGHGPRVLRRHGAATLRLPRGRRSGRHHRNQGRARRRHGGCARRMGSAGAGDDQSTPQASRGVRLPDAAAFVGDRRQRQPNGPCLHGAWAPGRGRGDG